MSLVLDASVTLAWYFDDEVDEAADDVLGELAQRRALPLATGDRALRRAAHTLQVVGV